MVRLECSFCGALIRDRMYRGQAHHCTRPGCSFKMDSDVYRRAMMIETGAREPVEESDLLLGVWDTE